VQGQTSCPQQLDGQPYMAPCSFSSLAEPSVYLMKDRERPRFGGISKASLDALVSSGTARTRVVGHSFGLVCNQISRRNNMAYAFQTTPAWQAPSLPPFLQDLLTFRGRMNRAWYWEAALILMGIAIAMGLIAGATLAMIKSSVAAVALVVIMSVALLALAVPGYFIAIKRLHDRNKSGHWLWLFCLAPGVLNLLGKLAIAQGAALVGMVIMLVSIGISIWGFVDMACLPGTSGPNRFGPDPLQAQPS